MENTFFLNSPFKNGLTQTDKTKTQYFLTLDLADFLKVMSRIWTNMGMIYFNVSAWGFCTRPAETGVFND